VLGLIVDAHLSGRARTQLVSRALLAVLSSVSSLPGASRQELLPGDINARSPLLEIHASIQGMDAPPV
jgi:hypothetical protein